MAVNMKNRSGRPVCALKRLSDRAGADLHADSMVWKIILVINGPIGAGEQYEVTALHKACSGSDKSDALMRESMGPVKISAHFREHSRRQLQARLH
jgi:hypothetical protein